MESNIVESSTCISLAFLLFLLLDISLNLDCGVIPVYLYEISDQFKLSRWNQGVLGSLSPAGFSVSTILFSYLLRRYSPKAILIVCLFVSIIANLAFAFATSWILLCFARFLFGAFLAVFFIYMPVWTDEFAPARFRTRWFGLFQACGPLGVILGFISSGLLIQYHLSWRVAFIIQCCVLLLCDVGLCFCPRRFIDVEQERIYPCIVPKTPECNRFYTCSQSGDSNSRSVSLLDSNNETCMPSSIRALFWDDDKDHSHSSSFLLRTNNGYVNEETRHLLQHTGDVSLQYNNDNVEKGLDRCANDPVVEDSHSHEKFGIYSFGKELCVLISNKLWICCCLTLSLLFYTIEGIRYWVVLYRQEVYSDMLSNIIFVFVIVSVTAPITGVLIGSHLIDILGGYKQPEARSRALKVVCVFGLLAFIPAWFCILKNPSNLMFFGVSLWLIIFFGAAMVAPLTGIMVSVVPYEHRSISSAVSLLISHIFGYIAAPLVTGCISQIYGIRIGFPFILFLGSFSLLFVLFALVLQTSFFNKTNSETLA
jgi:MFS family permease